MERNKENFICQSFRDRFIPTEMRSCAFQVENPHLKKVDLR